MKKKITLLFSLLLALVFTFSLIVPATETYASAPTDKITEYKVVIEVNDDATLNMLYHIEWKVLDDSIGKLDWVKVGIPNSHYVSITPKSETIKKISVDDSYSGTYAEVYFNRSYSENETVSFDFLLVQDYMYEMNVLTEGESVYYFTPGWFENMATDRIEIYWNADKALSWSHGAINTDDGWIVWSDSLGVGEKFSEISVTYPTTAFQFDESKTVQNDDDFSAGEVIMFLFAMGILFVPVLIVIVVIVLAVKARNSYNAGSNFSAGATTTKKITRTLIKYYPTCPGCGAARPENADKCEYCGRSFIESEEVVEETSIPDADKEKYSSEGTFRYGDSPNTYMRVHVVPVVVHRSTCVHSSCAHSSCACAHSCACACACACAGGGRAGCSKKDFYNTDLKLAMLMRKLKGKEK